MTAEMSAYEAEILIAVLTFAEGAALTLEPAIVEALKQLRPWRSALLQAYIRERLTAINSERPRADQHDGHLAAQANMDDWRLVKVGEVAPTQGGHGSWVETDHPAVIAAMGSVPQCAENGCQYRKVAPPGGLVDHLQGDK